MFAAVFSFIGSMQRCSAPAQSWQRSKGQSLDQCCYPSGKIFTAYSILTKYYKPTLKQIQNAIKNLDSCCTDFSSLNNGILYAVAAKHEREGKKVNAKK